VINAPWVPPSDGKRGNINQRTEMLHLREMLSHEQRGTSLRAVLRAILLMFMRRRGPRRFALAPRSRGGLNTPHEKLVALLQGCGADVSSGEVGIPYRTRRGYIYVFFTCGAGTLVGSSRCRVKCRLGHPVPSRSDLNAALAVCLDVRQPRQDGRTGRQRPQDVGYKLVRGPSDPGVGQGRRDERQLGHRIDL